MCRLMRCVTAKTPFLRGSAAGAPSRGAPASGPRLLGLRRITDDDVLMNFSDVLLGVPGKVPEKEELVNLLQR